MYGTAVLSVRLCGGFVVGDGERALGPRDVGGARARHVLLALLFEAGAGVSKGRLIECLWGAKPPAGALGTLEAYVSVLRKRLAAAIPGPTPVVTVPGGYRWDVDRAPVDVVEFTRTAAAARAAALSGADALPAYAAALALVESPVLPADGDAPWLEQHVTGHHARVLRVLTEAARCALDAGDPSLAESWARSALERDLLVESAWLVLLESLEQQGRQAEAVREYEACREVLATELGCDPGPGLRAVFPRLLTATSAPDGGLRELVDAVVRLHVGLLADGTPAPATGRVPTGGTREGRRHETDDIAMLQEDCRRLESLLRAASAVAAQAVCRSSGRLGSRATA